MAPWELGGAKLGKEKQMDRVGTNTSYHCSGVLLRVWVTANSENGAQNFFIPVY